jgi:energy-coupling factor transporter transmembrane protein EcfT
MFNGGRAGSNTGVVSIREHPVALILLVLLIVLMFGAAGFALHVLWWIALILLALWLLGFLFRAAESGGRSRRRWYRW